MPLVEVRVASELRTVLIDYRIQSKCKCFPWAANALGTSQDGLHFGFFPIVASPEDWGDSGKIPLLPVWFDRNGWGQVIYYTASEQAVNPKGPKCTYCGSPSLTVDGEIGYSALFIMPGPATGARKPGVWTQYIEDPQNSDAANNNAATNDTYVTPASTAMARDRLSLVPSNSPLQCTANSRLLFQHAPCELKKGTKKKTIKPECAYAVENLQICSCKTAAEQMVVKPCSKKIKKSACKTAVTTLKTCTV
jgi:hypothetical protein